MVNVESTEYICNNTDNMTTIITGHLDWHNKLDRDDLLDDEDCPHYESMERYRLHQRMKSNLNKQAPNGFKLTAPYNIATITDPRNYNIYFDDHVYGAQVGMVNNHFCCFHYVTCILLCYLINWLIIDWFQWNCQ